MEISRQKETRSRDYGLLVFWMTSRVLFSTQYHKQYCTLQASEQSGALYMHNYDDKSDPTGTQTWYLQFTSPSR